MELQVGVKILLKGIDGKYLLVRRNPEKYPEAGDKLWDIIGGRINPGSPLFDNLKREVKEEVDLDLSAEPKLLAAQDILRDPERHVVRLTYIGGASGTPKVDGIEHTECRWFGVEEIKALPGLDIYFKEVMEKNGL